MLIILSLAFLPTVFFGGKLKLLASGRYLWICWWNSLNSAYRRYTFHSSVFTRINTYTDKNIHHTVHHNTSVSRANGMPYSWKYWRELNLVVGSQIAISNVLADLNLVVRYRIAICTCMYASKKFWWILIWRLLRQSTKLPNLNSPPNFPAIQYRPLIGHWWSSVYVQAASPAPRSIPTMHLWEWARGCDIEREH